MRLDQPSLFEMANPTADLTGVQGVISISTAKAGHKPQLNWHPERPRDGAPRLSVTIEAKPKAFNHDPQLRLFSASAPKAAAWAALNHGPLLDFW